MTEAKVFIFDEPTKGIDVGTKVEIYKIMKELAQKEIGIIIVSSELQEIIGMCGRVLVMHSGVVRGELTGNLNEEEIMKYAV
jgi:ribose transport system ATP-binding protein